MISGTSGCPVALARHTTAATKTPSRPDEPAITPVFLVTVNAAPLKEGKEGFYITVSAGKHLCRWAGKQAEINRVEILFFDENSDADLRSHDFTMSQPAMFTVQMQA